MYRPFFSLATEYNKNYTNSNTCYETIMVIRIEFRILNQVVRSISKLRLEEFYSYTEKIQQKGTRKTKQNKGKLCTANNYIQ